MTNKIICYIRGVEIVETPEEKVRQEYARRLVEEYDYPKECIDFEVTITMGRDEKRRADIVVFRNKKKLYEDIYIIAETKMPDKEEGERQVKSYVSVTNAEIAIWTNGTEITYWERTKKPQKFISRGYLPKCGQFYGEKEILKSDLRPASNLVETFKKIHNNVYANAPSGNKGKVFYEIIYILFAKLQDERSYDKECQFVIYDREWDEIQEKGKSESFEKRVFGLFEDAKERTEYKSVFGGDEKVSLPLEQIVYIVSELEYLKILATDAKGEAFQTFISAYFRGEAGQFFTPDPVKKLIVEMIDPKPDEVVLDPACGSSGFLIFAIEHYKKFIKKPREWVKSDELLNDDELSNDQREILKREVKEIARDHIRGIDFDSDLTKVAKMYMVMVDDGHTGIHTVNSLIPLNQILKETKGMIGEETADIIMTNPPFGTKGKVSRKDILSEFDFGYEWKRDKKTGEFKKGKLLSTKKGGGQVPDILFIERCIEFLKPNGRMGIILPDGDLTNRDTEFVRAWLKDRAQIVAVVSLPQETFVPFGAGVKPSILFLKKLKGKTPKRYPIFFANLEKIGYDIRGRKTYKRNEKGEVIDDEERPIEYLTDRKGNKTKQDPTLIELKGALDTDVPEVLKEWAKFKKEFKSHLW